MNMIQYLRKKAGMKQTELCRELNIVQGTLSGWENGKYEPDISSLIKLSEFFNVSIDYILTGRTVAFTSNENDIPIYILRSGQPPEKSGSVINYADNRSGEMFFGAVLPDSVSGSSLPKELYIMKKFSAPVTDLPVIVNLNGDYKKGNIFLLDGKILFISSVGRTPDIIDSSSVFGEIIEMRRRYGS